MRKMLRLLPILFVIAFTSCREEAVSPVRNVRFDPNLLNKAIDGTACTSYTYTTPNGNKNLGAVYTQQVLVVFSKSLPDSRKEHVLQKYGFVRGLEGHMQSNAGMMRTVALRPGLSCKQTEQALRELADDAQITYAAPYFMAGSGLVGLSNKAIVTLKPGSLGLLQSYAASYKAAVLSLISDNVYLVQVDKHARGNTLELVDYLHGKPGIVAAEPDLIFSLPAPDKPVARTTPPVAAAKNYSIKYRGHSVEWPLY